MAIAFETLAVTDTIGQIIRDFGLIGLVALMFVENVFPPIPSEVVLPLAGFFVARGELSFIGVLFAATLGSVLGSILLYELARYGGRPLVLRYGSLLRVGPEELDRADAWFVRRGPIVVLVGRCIPGVRSLVSLPAGMLQMSRVPYILLTLAGSLVWNTALIGIGWILGEEWGKVSEVVGSVSTPLVIVVLLVLGAVSVVWWRRRPSRRLD